VQLCTTFMLLLKQDLLKTDEVLVIHNIKNIHLNNMKHERRPTTAKIFRSTKAVKYVTTKTLSQFSSKEISSIGNLALGTITT